MEEPDRNPRGIFQSMSTNPNTKTYWRRVSRMARELEFKLSWKYSEESVPDIIAAVDPKATKDMHKEAIKMAIENCRQSEGHRREEADQLRIARVTLQEFEEPIFLRLIDGGGAAAIRHRWPAVEE